MAQLYALINTVNVHVKVAQSSDLRNRIAFYWQQHAEMCFNVNYYVDYESARNGGSLRLCNLWAGHLKYNEKVTLKGLGLDGTHLLDHIHLHWGDKNDKGSEHSLDGKFYSAEVLQAVMYITNFYI